MTTDMWPVSLIIPACHCRPRCPSHSESWWLSFFHCIQPVPPALPSAAAAPLSAPASWSVYRQQFLQHPHQRHLIHVTSNIKLYVIRKTAFVLLTYFHPQHNMIGCPDSSLKNLFRLLKQDFYAVKAPKEMLPETHVHMKRCHCFFHCNFYKHRRIFKIFRAQLCKRMPKHLR